MWLKFIGDLQQVGGFLPVPSTNKTDRHDITEILMKVALNTINTINKHNCIEYIDFYTNKTHEILEKRICIIWMRIRERLNNSQN